MSKQSLPIEQDPRWAAVARRDTGADGNFVYAVRTTGVYCRPSCPSRLARPENVVLLATPAGFRACLRCRPAGATRAADTAARVAAACRMIETSDGMPSLERLADEAGLSPFHFHRVFKAATGLTPRAYAAGHRARRVRSHLTTETSVTEAIYEAGYNASSRFYETSGAMLGMTPRAYRNGGASIAITFAVGQCSLGSILVARSEAGICAILIGDDPDALARDLQDRFPRARLTGGDAAFEQVVATVVGFVEAPAIGLDLPLDIRGTAFQLRVWEALRAVPAGRTVSYTDLAGILGEPRAVRAVAGACAANALAVAIPCHRVVKRDGSLSGYRWGVERKRALLDREAGRG